MTIDTSGKWWIGTEPQDIKGFLDAYTEDDYSTDVFRLATCSCGSLEFKLKADNNEGAMMRICAKCAEEHYICDSEEYWDEAEPEDWECIECASKKANVGVGFSLYEGESDVRWLYIGVRCAKCGILGCFSDWKVGYGPSLHLMDQV